MMLFLLCSGRVKFYKTLWNHVYLRHLSDVRVWSTYRRRVDRVSVDSVDRCLKDTWKNDLMSSTKHLLDC